MDREQNRNENAAFHYTSELGALKSVLQTSETEFRLGG